MIPNWKKAQRVSSRFECPGSAVRLSRLLRRAQMALWTSIMITGVMHASLTLLWHSASGREAAKPLTTQFIKRRPRLSKPLELRKRPSPKRRHMRREMVAVKARSGRHRRSSRFVGAHLAPALARPSVFVARAPASAATEMEPSAQAQSIEGAKEHEWKVDMALEMVDVEALDTGKYRAMVVQDPSDRRAITGFLHLGVVYVETMFAENPEAAQLDIVDYIRRVVDGMNEYTDIQTDIRGRYTFECTEILRIPWIFLNTNMAVFKLTRSEAQNVGRYLTTGGFLYVETNCAHPWDRPGSPDGMWRRQELVSGKNMLKDALATAGYERGQDWTFEKLPNDHPLYHCYFDFEGPLPTYWPKYVRPDDAMHGITIDGRLLMIFETGDYERFINDAAADGSRYRQFLVNVIVFALTQEGSLTQRLMGLVNY